MLSGDKAHRATATSQPGAMHEPGDLGSWREVLGSGGEFRGSRR